ncbi:uncharacterized protein ACN2A1_009581 isoform 1-T1 [Glossina fuscipes fuscipes]|nr:hypothetical protein GQX74_000288 [Glossina fuscipes]
MFDCLRVNTAQERDGNLKGWNCPLWGNFLSSASRLEQHQVVDHETWIFNLTEAKEQGDLGTPRWFKEYDFSDFTNELSPAGTDQWLNFMAENPDLLRKFWSFKVTLSTASNNKCLSDTICQLAVSANNQKGRCQELQSILESKVSYFPTHRTKYRSSDKCL